MPIADIAPDKEPFLSIVVQIAAHDAVSSMQALVEQQATHRQKHH